MKLKDIVSFTTKAVQSHEGRRVAIIILPRFARSLGLALFFNTNRACAVLFYRSLTLKIL